jgi:uncharacterized membrane-anchored protein
MRKITAVSALLAWIALGGAVLADAPAPEQLTPQQQAQIEKLKKIAAGLHPQHGDIAIKGADATLHLGQAYYFLPADEARSVLVGAWDNPPEAVEGVLGLVFPEGKSFVDDTWAAVVTYEALGYVGDKDAKTVNYDDLIKSAHDGEEQMNEDRKAKGFAPLHLVGWAQPPSYDAAHHTLVWARQLHIGNAKEDTLNYDMRTLGRRGVLSMNIIDGMSKIVEVRGAAENLQNVATFNPGGRYQDYKEGTDKVAAYTVGGLVAAGLGVLAAKNLGLLGLGLLFLKKFIAIILAGAAGIAAWFRRMFSGRKAAAASATLPPPTQPTA